MVIWVYSGSFKKNFGSSLAFNSQVYTDEFPLEEMAEGIFWQKTLKERRCSLTPF